MKSPFPGMDPLIEASGLWGDFHDNLIADLARELAERVPDRYLVRLNARSYLVIGSEEARKVPMLPDVSIKRAQNREEGPEKLHSGLKSGGTTMVQSPAVMYAPLEIEEHETFIEIYDTFPERRLVTGIEVLSPSNKRPSTAGWDEYWRKRRAFLNGTANFVEIDLLRGGTRMPMQGAWPDSPYYILVSRSEESPRCSVWPAHALKPLPRIPIPLERSDADVEVDLQPIVDAIYDRARYAVDIDYQKSWSHVFAKEESELLESKP